MKNDEIATQQQLYACTRCGQLLGLLAEDGRLEVILDGIVVLKLVEGVWDCGNCGRRHGFRRAEEVPPFVEKYWPDGAQETLDKAPEI